MNLWDIIVAVGVLHFIYLVFRWFYFNYYLKLNLENYKYGYIAITGSTGGIGKALSLDLASRGFKILLISRNKEKLAQVTSEIQQATKSAIVASIECDFTYSHRNPEAFYTNLMKEISKYEVSGLINNVGFCELEYLHEQRPEIIEEIIGVNSYPQAMLSYYLIPIFLERYKESQKRSLLINLSSGIDLVRFPLTSVYSATKRYSEFLSEGMRLEYSHAVDVVTVKSGTVETPITVRNGCKNLPLTVKGDDFAKFLLDHLHSGINYGHWKHSFASFFISIMPNKVCDAGLKLMIPHIYNNILIKST